MKHFYAALAACAAFAVMPALAADMAPPFAIGPVWDYTEIKTKDGHFDDYMRWLSTEWKAQEEALKKAGYIMDYKVFVLADPRGDDPDILLATEYKNMAAMDTPVAEMYAFEAEQMGSVDKANAEQAARGSIRTIMGDVLTREVILK